MAVPIWSDPPLPLMNKVYGWMAETARTLNLPINLATAIAQAFEEAKLDNQVIMHEGYVENCNASMPFDWLADVMRGFVASALKHHVIASEKEVGGEKLAQRLKDEAVRAKARFINRDSQTRVKAEYHVFLCISDFLSSFRSSLFLSLFLYLSALSLFLSPFFISRTFLNKGSRIQSTEESAIEKRDRPDGR